MAGGLTYLDITEIISKYAEKYKENPETLQRMKIGKENQK